MAALSQPRSPRMFNVGFFQFDLQAFAADLALESAWPEQELGTAAIRFHEKKQSVKRRTTAAGEPRSNTWTASSSEPEGADRAGRSVFLGFMSQTSGTCSEDLGYKLKAWAHQKPVVSSTSWTVDGQPVKRTNGSNDPDKVREGQTKAHETVCVSPRTGVDRYHSARYRRARRPAPRTTAFIAFDGDSYAGVATFQRAFVGKRGGRVRFTVSLHRCARRMFLCRCMGDQFFLSEGGVIGSALIRDWRVWLNLSVLELYRRSIRVPPASPSCTISRDEAAWSRVASQRIALRLGRISEWRFMIRSSATTGSRFWPTSLASLTALLTANRADHISSEFNFRSALGTIYNPCAAWSSKGETSLGEWLAYNERDPERA